MNILHCDSVTEFCFLFLCILSTAADLFHDKYFRDGLDGLLTYSEALQDFLLSRPFVRSLDTSVSTLVARLLTTARSLAYLVVVRMLLLFYELHELPLMILKTKLGD